MSADDDERGQRRRRCGHLSWHRSQLAVTNSCANRAFAAEEGCQRDDAEDGRADTRGAELSHPFFATLQRTYPMHVRHDGMPSCVRPLGACSQSSEMRPRPSPPRARSALLLARVPPVASVVVGVTPRFSRCVRLAPRPLLVCVGH